jgi:hypothetical protein
MLQSAFFQRFVNNLGSALDETVLIGVLDAEDKRSSRPAGNEVGIQRRAEVADVHIARRAGGKAGADLTFRDFRFHPVKPILIVHVCLSGCAGSFRAKNAEEFYFGLHYLETSHIAAVFAVYL